MTTTDKTREIHDRAMALASRTIDELTAEVMALRAQVVAWEETARKSGINADFWRGIVMEVGEMFDDEAKTADDGTVMQDVLALRVVPLVRALKHDAKPR